jgi:hypothetical protein
VRPGPAGRRPHSLSSSWSSGRPRRRPFFRLIRGKLPLLAFFIHPCSILDPSTEDEGPKDDDEEEYGYETLNRCQGSPGFTPGKFFDYIPPCRAVRTSCLDMTRNQKIGFDRQTPKSSPFRANLASGLNPAFSPGSQNKRVRLKSES